LYSRSPSAQKRAQVGRTVECEAAVELLLVGAMTALDLPIALLASGREVLGIDAEVVKVPHVKSVPMVCMATGRRCRSSSTMSIAERMELWLIQPA